MSKCPIRDIEERYKEKRRNKISPGVSEIAALSTPSFQTLAYGTERMNVCFFPATQFEIICYSSHKKLINNTMVIRFIKLTYK